MWSLIVFVHRVTVLIQSCCHGAWGESQEMFRKTFHISEATAGGHAKLGAPGVAWRTFRSQGHFSSGSCSLCWWPQTAEGRRNTFKSVLLKLNSSVLSLGERVENKESGVNFIFFLPSSANIDAYTCTHSPNTLIYHYSFWLNYFLDFSLAEFAYVMDDLCDCIHVICIHRALQLW